MILTCPNCETQFALDPARLGNGRTVRCARCQETWFAEPPQDHPVLTEPPLASSFTNDTTSDPFSPPADTDQTAIENQAFSDALRPAEKEATDGPQNEPFEDDAPNTFRARMRSASSGDEKRNLPALLKERDLTTVLGWSGLGLFVLCVILGTIFFAREITAAWPQSAKLYDSLGLSTTRSILSGNETEATLPPLEKRLRLADLKPSQRFIDGVPTLIINGRIESKSSRIETLPQIEVLLLDAQKIRLKSWTVTPPQPSLRPGASATFETRLANPPTTAQDIRVTFSKGANAQVQSPKTTTRKDG